MSAIIEAIADLITKGYAYELQGDVSLSSPLRFSKDGVPPTIEITARRIKEKSFTSPEKTDGAYCFIRIIDNGIGFDDRYVQNIFSLFERLNSKDKYEGTGIGLAIAKKMLKQTPASEKEKRAVIEELIKDLEEQIKKLIK